MGGFLVFWWFGTRILWLFIQLGRIVPTDKLIFFRGVGIPPTSFAFSCLGHRTLAILAMVLTCYNKPSTEGTTSKNFWAFSQNDVIHTTLSWGTQMTVRRQLNPKAISWTQTQFQALKIVHDNLASPISEDTPCIIFPLISNVKIEVIWCYMIYIYIVCIHILIRS